MGKTTRIRLGAVLVLTLLGTSHLDAQATRSDPTDFQGWYGANLDVELPRGWEASLQYRLRMVDQASDYRGSYFYGKWEYEVAGWLAVLGNYRLGLVDDAVLHRYALGAQASQRLGDLRLSARSIIQHRTRTIEEDDEYTTDERTLLRTRLRARHPLTGSLDAYVSTEPFFTLEGEDRLDNVRNEAGLRWEYARGKRVDLFYIYRPNFRRSFDRTYHVVGVELNFEARPFR